MDESIKTEAREAYKRWLLSEEGQKPTDPNLLKKWRQNLLQEEGAYARGERPLVTAMEEEREDTRGSWSKREGKPLVQEKDIKKKLYVLICMVITELLESDFFKSLNTIREAESIIEKKLKELEAKRIVQELLEEEKGLLEMLAFLHVQIPLLKREQVIKDETVLSTVPDDLERRMGTI